MERTQGFPPLFLVGGVEQVMTIPAVSFSPEPTGPNAVVKSSKNHRKCSYGRQGVRSDSEVPQGPPAFRVSKLRSMAADCLILQVQCGCLKLS